jgi:hypothetical protein
MGVPGTKPKTDRSQVRHKNPTYDFTEVDDVPFEGAPALRDRATGGISVIEVGAANSADWPGATLEWWGVVSRMPHCKLWTESDWRFAMDTAEIHARTMEAWRGYTGSELRQREKLMGTYADARRDLRIRYVEPKPKADPDAVAAGVTRLDDYRGL